MNTKQRIIEIIKERKAVSGSEIAKILGISRQAVNKHISELVKSGLVEKEGSTRKAFYHLSERRKKTPKKIEKILKLGKVSEDRVFEEISLSLNLRKNLSKNAYEIYHYSFTEILNNAIDHSESDLCRITAKVDSYNVSFTIRDFGIGIFNSISSKFNLPDESSAVLELIKGKRTTKPKRHSGEGIFFTSKSGDILKIRSHKILLTFDNIRKDIFFGTNRHLKGTEVCFSVKRYSKRSLSDVFNMYAPEVFEYKFSRTKVFVKLLQCEYVSRSEAKRLIISLDKFKEIVLDFKGVKNIGQGFADEIFRVFTSHHPDINIKIVNISPDIKKIIEHVKQ